MAAAERNIIFRETQRFAHLWLVALIVIMAAGAWFAAAAQFFFDWPTEYSVSDDVLMALVWLLTGVGLPALFLSACLITEVRVDGLYVRFVPFHRRFRKYGWEELSSSEARQYRPIREYGGWGIRGVGKNRAYNVSGVYGLQLVFKDGRRLLVGSRQAKELAAAVVEAGGPASQETA